MAGSVTPLTLFALGLLIGSPFAIAYVVLRVRAAPPDPSRARIALRLDRLSRRLALVFVLVVVLFVVWVGIAASAHVLADLRSEALLLLGLVWLFITPLVGLRLLAASLRRAASGPRGA